MHLYFCYFLLFSFFIACQGELKEKPNTEKKPLTHQQTAQLKQGKDLFWRYCLSCHNDDMKTRATAPPLGGVAERRDKKWLYEFTRNSEQFIAKKDSVAIALLQNYKSLMPNFEFLTDEELNCIYLFVEQAALENKILLRPVER